MMLTDMRQYLIDKGINVPIYAGNMPPKPNDCIELYEYAGLPLEQGATKSPGLQIMARSKDFVTGYCAITAAVKNLLEIGYEDGTIPEGVRINGTLYLRVIANASGINQLGKDENGAHMFSCGLYVIMKEE